MTITQTGTLSTGDPEYTNFTVSPGVVLTVPSGTVIRCTGGFTNYGEIDVRRNAAGGQFLDPSAWQIAGAGLSPGPASNGGYTTTGATIKGGVPSGAIGATECMLAVRSPAGGGGGGGSFGAAGGAGGGAFAVIAQGTLLNVGTIDASGEVTPARRRGRRGRPHRASFGVLH